MVGRLARNSGSLEERMRCWWRFGHVWSKWADHGMLTDFTQYIGTDPTVPRDRVTTRHWLMQTRTCAWCGRIETRRVAL